MLNFVGVRTTESRVDLIKELNFNVESNFNFSKSPSDRKF